ncbi:hypothetical protein PanWU01x14_127370 [Parasponia andersonii]|uniref:RNase H type-1 domain-containing protein n=1 Tax=Parasponia andersonii TaxID=3476 RepID=A0A2P5CSF2_PARAD|nr:hypothetical protein PanWU01x14_127370 [Parasponia andersonii]
MLVRNPLSYSWSRPSNGFKLNTDAMFWSGVLSFGCGGVIRESFGLVLACWSCFLPSLDDIEICKFLAPREGIKLTIDFGCILDEIESDSFDVVNTILKHKSCYVVTSLISNIFVFISSVGYSMCCHVSHQEIW